MGRRSKNRSVFVVSLLAGVAFLALAVWGWGLTLSDLGKILVGLLIGLAAIVFVAFLGASLLAAIKKLRR